MARGKAHSEEIKATVLAALLAGVAVQEASRQYQINERVIRRWRSEQLSEVVRQKKERIAVRLLEYLDEAFLTLTEQHKTFRDEKYLRKQSASQLAALHGVIADKTFRLLEGVSRLDAFSEDEEESAESTALSLMA